MGKSLPLLLVRAAGILCAGLLLFSVFSGAHAQRYDDYGLTPVGAATDFTPATAMMPRTAAATANNGYNAAPVNGGYVPPNGSGAPSNSGYGNSGYGVPDPLAVPVAANGQYASPLGTQNAPMASAPPQPLYQNAPPQPAPIYQPQRPAQANAPTDYGYKPLPGGAAPQAGYGGYQMAPSGPSNPGYLLGAGDKLRLTVFEETDLSGDYTVDGTGFVRLPLVGQIRAAGYTTQQLEGAIAGALSQGYLKSPRVAVEVSIYRPFYIIGAVSRPGQYPYINNMNALNAIALAGGFTPAAVESVLYVRREGTNREMKMATDRSTPIYPGDVVRVDSTVFADAMQLLNPLSTPLSIAAAAAVP